MDHRKLPGFNSQTLFDALPLAVAVLDSDSMVHQAVNSAYREITGRSTEELLGCVWTDLIKREQKSSLLAQIVEFKQSPRISWSYRTNLERGNWVHPAEVTFGKLETTDGQSPVLAVHVVDLAADETVLGLFKLVAERPSGSLFATAAALGPLRDLNVTALTIYQFREADQTFRLVGGFGNKQLADVYDAVSISDNVPMSYVFRTGVEHLSSLRELMDRYPLTSAWGANNPNPETAEYFQMPIRSRGVVIGVVGIEFAYGMPRTWESRMILDGVAAATAAWCVVSSTRFQPVQPSRLLKVTERQRRVVALIRAGMTNQQIADTVGFSEGTIRSDITTLSKLFGVRGRLEIAERAVRAGF